MSFPRWFPRCRGAAERPGRGAPGLQRLDQRSPTTRRCLPNLQAAELGSQLQADAILRQSRITVWIKATSRIWNLLTKQPWTKIGTCALSTDGVRGRREKSRNGRPWVRVCRVGIKCQIFHRTPFLGGGIQNTIPIPGSDHMGPLSMEIFLI